MYLTPDKNNKKDSTVVEVQRMLNVIRTKYNMSWPYLNDDGIYGHNTASVVLEFQKKHGLSSVMSKDGPILGDTTITYIRECFARPILHQHKDSTETQINKKKVKQKNTFDNIYSPISATVGSAAKISDAYTPVEAMTNLLKNIEKLILQQADNFRNRIGKLPSVTRQRHLLKALEKSREFIAKAQKYGVNEAAVITYGSLTKDDVIKYFKEAADAISNSKVTAAFKKASAIFTKIKNALKPLYDFFNKIPGLKYLGAIEKIIRGIISLFQLEFEKSFSYFLDGIRDVVESVLVDLAVAALIALGGWLAIVMAIVLVVVVMVIDYFFFSDNSGDSLVDKYTPLSTQNVVQDTIAPWIYNKVL